MRTSAILGLMATALTSASPALAADPTAPEEKDGPDLEVYGTLLPFFENVGTDGATVLAPGVPSPAPNLANRDQFTGINHERRFRMTSGTSHLGFRGDLPIAGSMLKLIWQVESPTPIDGEGPSNWASRNSHIGLTGDWGTLIYGNWDTPMKWASVTTVNPIKGGYVADLTPLIGSPGFSTPAWNTDPTFLALIEAPPNRAGFFRHEVNAVQYWSPTVAGFSARLMFASNEHRLAGIPNSEPALNPFMVSGYLGYDNDWLRVRFAHERHYDYFGTGNISGQVDSLNSPGSEDYAHLGVVAVTINGDTDYKTKVVLTGDYLNYHTEDTTAAGIGIVTDVSRAAVYGLVQQQFGMHTIWGAYGTATEGTCSLRGSTCVTTGLSAQYGTLGYLLSFTKNSGVYAIAYGLFNDIAARYSPFPILEAQRASATFLPNIGRVPPGADTTGFGIGFVHSFNVEVFGGKAQAPVGDAQSTKVPEAPAAEPADKAPPTEPTTDEEEDEEEEAAEGEEAAPAPQTP